MIDYGDLCWWLGKFDAEQGLPMKTELKMSMVIMRAILTTYHPKDLEFFKACEIRKAVTAEYQRYTDAWKAWSHDQA